MNLRFPGASGAVKRFVLGAEAPTMIEYGLLVAVIALVVVVGASTFGFAVVELFKIPPEYFEVG